MPETRAVRRLQNSTEAICLELQQQSSHQCDQSSTPNCSDGVFSDERPSVKMNSKLQTPGECTSTRNGKSKEEFAPTKAKSFLYSGTSIERLHMLQMNEFIWMNYVRRSYMDKWGQQTILILYQNWSCLKQLPIITQLCWSNSKLGLDLQHSLSGFKIICHYVWRCIVAFQEISSFDGRNSFKAWHGLLWHEINLFCLLQKLYLGDGKH